LVTGWSTRVAEFLNRLRPAFPTDDHDWGIHKTVLDGHRRTRADFRNAILVFFLALMRVITARWMWRNLRYSILAIFVLAAIVIPTTDILNMCLFAAPMVGLYGISIGVAWLVNPGHGYRASAL
jgi:Sec-independent protein translocase protein (TatC)